MGICRLSCTSMVRILNSRLDSFLTENLEYPFVIYFDVIRTFQFISYPAVSLVRTFGMYFFYGICNSQVFYFVLRYTSVPPFIEWSSAYLTKFSENRYWITISFMFFFDYLIDPVSGQAQPRLLSISLSFFKKDISISTYSFSARSSLFSALNRSSSVISTVGFVRPRRSCNASMPFVSYLMV